MDGLIARRSAYLTSLAGLLSLLVFGALSYPLWFGKLYLRTDLGYYHLPLRMYYQRCLLQGDRFAWMPDIFCGFYAAGEGQAGMFHPLHWALYRFLPLTCAFNIEFLYSYPFVFAGTYLLLRRWHMPTPASLFGALTFSASGFCLLHGIHTNMLQVAAHTPWLLLAIDHLLDRNDRSGNGWRWWAAVVLLTASQLLLGFPQGIYLSSLAECLYVLLLICGRQPLGILPRLCALLAAKLLAFALAAIQLLPSYEILLESQRGYVTPAFRTAYSLDPVNLLQFLGPYFFANGTGFNVNPDENYSLQEMGFYCGASAALLALWALARMLRRGAFPARKLAVGSVAVIVLGLLLSMGKHGPIYPWLSQLPPLSAFRCPGRHIVLVEMGLAALSAIGFSDLLQTARSGERVPWRRCGLLFLPALAGWGAAAYFLGVMHAGFPFPEAYKPMLASGAAALWISPALMTLAATLIAFAARGRLLALAGVLILAAADQAYYGVGFAGKITAPMTLAEYIDNIPAPPAKDGFRVDAKETNLLSVSGIENRSGYIGPFLHRRLLSNANQEKVRQLANVHWVLPVSPRFGNKNTWEENPHPFPYVRMLARAQITYNVIEDLDKVNLATTALTYERVDPPEGSPGQADLIEKRPGKMVIHTQSATRQLLAVSESWHPGWRVWIDGLEAPVLRINGDFQGCAIDAGNHEVRFSFEPMGIVIGRRITLASLVVLTAACFALRYLNTRGGSGKGA